MLLLKDHLILLRKRKGYGQAMLATRSKVSRRQIVRIETEPNADRRKTTIERLAKALGVKTGVLTGEIPMPDHEGLDAPVAREVGKDTESVSARVSPEVRLAYDLVSTCFGVSVSDLVRVAPLLLALLAAASFSWRKEQVEEARKAVDQLYALGSGPGKAKRSFHHFMNLGYPVEDLSICEKGSIERRDLFGTDESFDSKYGQDYPGHGQAFSDYLRVLAAESDCQDLVAPEDIPSNEFEYLPPSYKVCQDTLERLSGRSEEFRRALECQDVRIQDIPEILLADFPGRRYSDWEKLKNASAHYRALWFEGRQSGSHDSRVERLLVVANEYEKKVQSLSLEDLEL